MKKWVFEKETFEEKKNSEKQYTKKGHKVKREIK